MHDTRFFKKMCKKERFIEKTPTLFAKIHAYNQLEDTESFSEAFIRLVLCKSWKIRSENDRKKELSDERKNALDAAERDVLVESETLFNSIERPITANDASAAL